MPPIVLLSYRMVLSTVMDCHVNLEVDIYVNLGVEVRLWLNAGGESNATARKMLLNAWDAMALREDFDSVNIYEFAKLSQRVRADRERRKRDFSVVNSRFSLVGPVPPPRGRLAAPRRR